MDWSFLRLGWRTLWRDARAGSLRLLVVAVTLAVAALCAVGFFSDRLQRGLQRDALQLLGGDAVVVSDNPTPDAFVERARALGLRSVTSISFATMARADDAQGGASKLVALKSVELGYPLRGSLRVVAQEGGPERSTREIPARGTVWVDAALLEALGLRLGDALLLGDARFRITHTIAFEPDRGAGFINFAPRAMIAAADLLATGLVQPASRLTYRFAVAGPPAAVRSFVRWAEAALKQPGVRGVRLETLETGRPEMRQTLERADKFLNLVALLAALLSAVAVALAARSFAAARPRTRLRCCACSGESQRSIAGAYVTEVCAAGSRWPAAWAWRWVTRCDLGFVQLLAGLVESGLPAPSGWPVAFGLGMGLTLLLSFGLPPVLQLAQVPPLRVLRRDVGGLRPASLGVLGVGTLGFAALLLAVGRDLKLGAIAVGGFAGAVLLFAALAWGAVALLRAWVRTATAPRWWILAVRQLAARPAYTVMQISSLAVGLLALVLLVLLRTDLISSWRQATPPDAPNRFVINILPEQAQAFRARLHAAGVRQYDWYPMVRGRLVAINGQPVGSDSFTEDRARQLVEREFNLSYTSRLPAHNVLVAGRWVAQEAGAISVEEGLAKTLGLQLGDRLRFDMAGVQNEARITSVRKVDWSSMRANFFVLYPLDQLEGVAATYLAAFRAPALTGFDNALVREFPNITAVDLSQTLGQVQRVLDQVIAAVEFLFVFTLAAGLVVLFAAVSATREERAREFAILRALGASARLLRTVQRAELLGVGLLAGLLASVAALAVGWALAHYVFDFAWTAPVWVPLAGALAGALLALAAGWWSLREVLRRPVMETLRRAVE